MLRRNFLKTSLFGGAAAAHALQFGSVSLGQSASPGTLRLNSNENPRGLSRSARDAVVRALSDAGRYPLSRIEPMQKKLADRHGLQDVNVSLGNGSSEILQMVAQGLGRNYRVVVADPTFEAIVDYAKVIGLEVVKVPLRSDFSHDVPAMRRAAESSPSGALVYICNPNNPTGTLTPCREIEDWVKADRSSWFLIDEAYFEFVSDPSYWSFDRFVNAHPNLVVSRTFSKAFGMAGLRFGYALAAEETTKTVRLLASDVNINHLAMEAAWVSLDEPGYVRESVELNRRSKTILLDTLDDLGVAYLPSHGNFVMHRIKRPLEPYIQSMKEKGVLVGREFPPYLDYNRVSIGLPGEMERFSEVLREFRKLGWV